MDQNPEERDSLNFKSILALVTNHWYWFVISIVIFMGLGFLKIKTTTPSYTRTAQILIKDEDTGNNYDDFAALELMNKPSNIYNELAVLQSPDLMAEVVLQLNLNQNYTIKKSLHKEVLYGVTLPILVNVDSVTGEKGINFDILVENGTTFELSKFKLQNKKVGQGESIKGRFDVPVNTPVGPITITKTPYFSTLQTPNTISFSHSGIYFSALSYSKKVNSKVHDTKSSLIDLSISDYSIARGDDVLRTLIETYNRNWVKDKNEIAYNTACFLNARLASIESELDTIDNNISSFKSENLLPDLTASSNIYMQQSQQAEAKLLELNNQLYMAKYVKDYLAASSNRQTLPVNSGFESQALSQIITQYNQKVLERNNLASLSSDNNPAVVDMDAALADYKRSISASIDNDIASIKEQIKNQERYQNEAISQIASNPAQAKYLIDVERQQKVKESLYLFLLQKREDNELTKTFSTENAHIIQAPNGLPGPSSPKSKIILILAFMLGVGVPFAILYLRERAIDTVTNRKQIESLPIPFLGEIPYCKEGRKGGLLRKFKEKIGMATPEEAMAVVVEKGNRNVVNEAFRIMRTNLAMMAGKGGNGNVVAFTSYNPGSGKSFITMNLAMTVAFRNKKILVIDCDLRHGSSSQYVTPRPMGLTDYLAGNTTNPDSMIVDFPDNPDLKVIPIGKIPPNPTELLENGKLKQLINSVKDEYDFIFLDCPPVDLVADTQIIAPLADRTVFVVRVGLFKLELIPSLENLYRSKIYKNMALILNGVQVKKSRYYSNGRKSYYYFSK